MAACRYGAISKTMKPPHSNSLAINREDGLSNRCKMVPRQNNSGRAGSEDETRSPFLVGKWLIVEVNDVLYLAIKDASQRAPYSYRTEILVSVS